MNEPSSSSSSFHSPDFAPHSDSKAHSTTHKNNLKLSIFFLSLWIFFLCLKKRNLSKKNNRKMQKQIRASSLFLLLTYSWTITKKKAFIRQTKSAGWTMKIMVDCEIKAIRVTQKKGLNIAQQLFSAKLLHLEVQLKVFPATKLFLLECVCGFLPPQKHRTWAERTFSSHFVGARLNRTLLVLVSQHNVYNHSEIHYTAGV